MASAKAPARQRGNRTAARILDAALDAFGTRGYGATSLDDLARELGIRKQTILYWYPSKEALLDAVERALADVVAACWAGAWSAPSPRTSRDSTGSRQW